MINTITQSNTIPTPAKSQLRGIIARDGDDDSSGAETGGGGGGGGGGADARQSAQTNAPSALLYASDPTSTSFPHWGQRFDFTAAIRGHPFYVRGAV
jgi:hypothetical protein